MSTRPSKAPSRKAASTGIADVTDLMRTLEHPHKGAIEEVRRVILGAHPSVTEGVKWNAPSFRTSEWFATVNLRAKAGVAVVLHLGAKVRDEPPGWLEIDDPRSLLQWLGKDRAMVTFASESDVAAKRDAFTRVVRQWIAHV